METLQRTANRGSLSTGYEIENSVKLEPDNSEFLSRTIGSTSNRKTFTVSCWFKRTELKAGAADANGHNLFMAGGDSTSMVSLQFHTWQDTYADTLEFRVVGSSNNNTTRRFRDTSAWYHVVLAVDTTQATEANRWKLYVNGVQETSFSQTSYPSQNADTVNNVANNVVRIGTKPYAGNEFGYFAGYIADYYHIDGEALAPTDFGEFDEDSGIWKPKAYTGSFGTNGWYLDFVDGADLGDDESGNGNDFTEINISASDQATDTPTNNFTTWNTRRYFNQGTTVFKEGGTVIDNNFAGGFSAQNNNMRVNKGKWYAEFEILETGSYLFYGIIDADYIDNSLNADFYLGSQANGTAGVGFYASNNSIYRTGDYESAGVTSSAGDIIGVALDCDNNKVHFALNNTWTNSSNPATNANGWATTGNDQYFASASLGDKEYKCNFGGFTVDTISSAESDANGYGTFEYAPPSGFYSLCTKNLAEYG
jgi:hypothetical protein